ncbi:hypothetical protein [Taibaiella koreensis]|uniref:hypothetical protein n=1 Tax=Taibaiella koreensis TaxID=1268548 RepID=UPI001F09D7F3|nr:hypothetical protein [Taibaiella koreensis]
MIETAGIAAIRKELDRLPPKTLKALCLRLAAYKKENKELLSYLLFEADNEAHFISAVKEEIDLSYADINKANLYWAKKSIRKILRITNKYIKYSAQKPTEVELLLHFCQALNASGIAYRQSTTLRNLYQNQLKKLNKALSTLHEDLQYDYADAIAALPA